MPLGLGTTEMILILILIIILIVMPSKLPQFVRSIGESIREFRRASKEVSSEEVEALKKAEKEVASKEKEGKIDEETLRKLAEKLGVSTEGKSKDELVEEVVKKAKEKGLI
jgi:sec-independent protein translocase protein TatA